MKVQVIFLKSDLIGIIDGIDVDLGPTDVILQRAWKLQEGKTLADVLLNCWDNQLTIVQHLTKVKETWDFFKTMYEHVDISTRLMVKKKFTTLVMQEGKSTISSMEKFQDSLNRMACVGLVVDDQEVVIQLLTTLLPSYKTFVTIVGNMQTLTLPILMAKL